MITVWTNAETTELWFVLEGLLNDVLIRQFQCHSVVVTDRWALATTIKRVLQNRGWEVNVMSNTE